MVHGSAVIKKTMKGRRGSIRKSGRFLAGYYIPVDLVISNKV